MKNKCFYNYNRFISNLMIVLIIFFITLVGAGCNGGNSSGKLKVDSDSSLIEYFASEIFIGYAKGDSAKYVTQDLTLPTNIGSADISWVTNSSAVSSNGTVTRQDTDTDVTLTATVSYNKKSNTKIFNVKVIKKRTRINSEITPLTIYEAKSGDVTIDRNELGNITNIEGQYVKFDIMNADDALDAITVLRNELGIKSPTNELEIFKVTSDAYSSEYKFQQIYNGVRVLGRRIMVSTNSNYKGDFLHSSFLSSDTFEKANMQINRTISDAENIAKHYYSGEFEANSDVTEMIVYSLEDDYFTTPVYAYIVNVSGTNDNGIYINEKIIVNASTGQIIKTFTSIDYAMNTGKNEKDTWVVFPVIVSEGYSNMIDTTDTPKIEIYNGDVTSGILWWQTTNIVRNKLGQAWNDKQAISAYVNMREIMKWWKDSFNRNSIDDDGMTVKVIVHQSVHNREDAKYDNAAWDNASQKIYISDNNGYSYSFASAVDLLTHETTHAVLQYETSCDNWSLNSTLKSITEGYADLFACLKDQHWTIGESLYSEAGHYVRDIEECRLPNTPSGIQQADTYRNGVKNIAHVAYLMHENSGVENGLTWDELGKLWYKSIRKELAETSTFEDVRRCVKWAANELSLSEQKRNVINNAFEQTEVYAKQTILTGFVTDYLTEKYISGVGINAEPESIKKANSTYVSTNSLGYFSMQLYKGWKYIITVDAADYVPFEIVKTIEKSTGDRLNVQLVKIGSGTITGTIYENETNKSSIEGITLKIRSGWNNQSGDPILTTKTDASGQYTFDLGDKGAGYYTIEMIKDGYTTSTFNVTVSGETKWKDEYLSGKGTTNPNNEGSDNTVDPEEPNAPTSIVNVPIDETHFPDEIFRTYVQSNFDTDNNNILSATEIAKITKIVVNHTDISTLTGIEYFTDLEYMECENNQLTTLDVSKNTVLATLHCSNNKLTTLNVNGCTALKYLYCHKNKLTTLNVNSCTALIILECQYNQLTTLDISKNADLKFISCENNQLTTLNVNGCTALNTLYCKYNQLTVLDLTNCLNIDKYYVKYDTNVTVIWPVTTSSTASTTTVEDTGTPLFTSAPNAMTIIASIPKFTATRTGEYVFDVSIDNEILENSRLILLNNSEDLNGVFIEDNKNLKVSANFEAGQTYSPVIVATDFNDSDNNGNGGGCNIVIFGILILFTNIVLLKKR